MTSAVPEPWPRLRDAPFIAADVGGTHVRIGLVQPATIRPIRSRSCDYRKYRCAEYPGLGEILADFIGTLEAPVTTCVIASAGYPPGRRHRDHRQPAVARCRRARSRPDRLGLRDLRLVNDFEAVAHAAAWSMPAKCCA